MNGVNGASSLVTVTRQVRRVPNAAGSPSQKRRRERRTDPFLRASTKAWIAGAAAADVPVAEVVDERLDCVAGAGGVVVLQALRDRLDRRRQPRERPAVE